MQKQIDKEQGIATMSKSMLIVVIFTMVSKVTGFLRESVLASQYGISVFTDAFKTAQDLPCLFLSIIVTALSATLIPAYSGQQKLGAKEANRFINNLYTVGLVLSIVVLVATAIFMEPLAAMFTSRADDPQVHALTVQLAMVMLPMGIFVFLARITGAFLQANFNFTVPALSQLFLNLTIIGAIMLSQGLNITYVAIGTVIGWALTFLVQLPALRRTGLQYRPVFDLKEAGFREVMILMLPVLVSSAFDQLYILFDKMVAFGGITGDPTALDYANRVSTMASSVLLTTIATVLYPNLVRNADSRERFTDNLSFGINLNLLIGIPITVAMILLTVPITRLVYERGEFDAASTQLTATLLACYCAGIFGVGMRELCNRCFYAFKDTIVPTIVGTGVVILNVVLNFALHPIFGPAGIAAATSISSLISGFVLLLLLHIKKHVLDGKRIVRCLWRVLVATGLMAAGLLVVFRLFSLGTRGGMGLLAGLAIAFVVGVALYIVALLILRTDELTMLVNGVKRRLGRR